MLDIAVIHDKGLIERSIQFPTEFYYSNKNHYAVGVKLKSIETNLEILSNRFE